MANTKTTATAERDARAATVIPIPLRPIDAKRASEAAGIAACAALFGREATRVARTAIDVLAMPRRELLSLVQRDPERFAQFPHDAENLAGRLAARPRSRTSPRSASSPRR